jgi:hypothetical protein
MGMKKLLGIVICFLFLTTPVCFSLVSAQDQITVTGLITTNENGDFVIQVGDKTYVLDGYVEDLEGRNVEATGIVETGDDGVLFLVVETAAEIN